MSALAAEPETPVVSLLGQIKTCLDNLNKRADQAARRDEARLRNEPTSIPILGSPILGSANDNPVIPATGPLLLTLGGPELGYRWVIKRLWVSDAGIPTATVTGAAYFFVGQPVPPPPAAASLAGWVPVPASSGRWIFANLPNATTFTSDAVVVKATDQLLCVITGGTPGQAIIAQGEAVNESLTTAVLTVT